MNIFVSTKSNKSAVLVSMLFISFMIACKDNGNETAEMACKVDADCRCKEACTCKDGECVHLVDDDQDTGDEGGRPDTFDTSVEGDSLGDTNESVSCGDVVSPDPQLVRSCILDLSCSADGSFETISACITENSHFYPCAYSAQTCVDIVKCKGPIFVDSAYCPEGSPHLRCEGNLEINCGEPVPSVFDCANFGAVCHVYDESDSPEGQIYLPCLIVSPETCADEPGVFRCRDNYVYTCLGGEFYGYDCGSIDQHCIELSAGEAFCSRWHERCDDIETVSCQGNAIRVCTDNGYELLFDCTPGGGRCHVDENNIGYCLSPGCTPQDDEDCEEACLDETTMNLCVGGAPFQVDCTDYGFDGCAMSYFEDAPDDLFVGCY